MTQKEYAEEYNRIYKEADAAFRKYDPCKFHKNKCTRDREKDTWNKNGCCYKCRYLGPRKGCRIKCLGCKLFLCPWVSEKYPELKRILTTLWKSHNKIRVKGISPDLKCHRPKVRHLRMLSLEIRRSFSHPYKIHYR